MASPEETKVDSITDIVTSKSDEREYRCITLPNKLDVFLVSDPETEKAAASMAVNVGYYADPDQIPGLAHFLEHMLFLGTKKYPNESEYDQFIQDHGGSNNAWTDTHQTVYIFDIHSDHLDSILDRFAQFFIAPLFTETATDRELNAVNSEFSNSLQSDAWRLQEFENSLAKESHERHKFGTGNIDTLKNKVPENIRVREELIKFHENHYSSSIMKLCILGKESLDDLEKMAIEKFSEIKLNPNQLQPPKYSKDVYDPSTFPMLYKIVPVKERREIKICWPISPTYDNWRERPTKLFGFCMGDEGPGSILAYLKAKGWATELVAGQDEDLPEIEMQSCGIDLTPDGLENWTKVVSIVYAYIYKMKQLTDEQWNAYYKERKTVSQMQFDYKGKERAYGYTSSIASKLDKYPAQHILECIRGMAFDFDVNKTKNSLNELNIDGSYYILMSKDFEGECKSEEPWYGTKYNKIEINNETLNEWKMYLNGTKTVENDETLHTPPLNPYIADNFDVCCEKNESKEEKSTEPEVILDRKGHRLWYRMDDTFKRPKLCYFCKLYNPLFDESPRNNILTEIVMSYLNDALSKDTYAFEEANLSYKASYSGADSLSFNFTGFNQKLSQLVDTVLNKFSNLEFDESRFNDIYESEKRNVLSKTKNPPYRQTFKLLDYMTRPGSFTNEELIAAVDNITLDEVKQHYNKFLDNIFIEGLLFGNIDKEGTKVYEDLVNKYLIDTSAESTKTYRTMSDIIDCRKGALNMPQDNSLTHVIRYKLPNEEEKNNAVVNEYRYELDSVNVFAKLKLFMHLISVPCYDTLRTKEQLGYIVASQSNEMRGIHSAMFIIQSNESIDPIKVDERIEIFLKEFGENILPKIDKETFETNKISIINNLLEKPKSIAQLGMRYWAQITGLRYDFSRREKIAKEIEKLVLEDVITVYNDYIAQNAPKRCKLSVQSFGSGSEIPVIENKDNMLIFGPEKVIEFREKYGYNPYPYTKGKDVGLPQV